MNNLQYGEIRSEIVALLQGIVVEQLTRIAHYRSRRVRAVQFKD
jgi:hypothetical protein